MGLQIFSRFLSKETTVCLHDWTDQLVISSLLSSFVPLLLALDFVVPFNLNSSKQMFSTELVLFILLVL